ncbi:CBS domain-containing protein [Desulfonispora thiosulfatigenes DSM 11270]|uniref:CBS domain-containing protein n=1 Tax=Desulfonispora thiosulfatigenes DSM 11270 TaxID=656914 RepID=A0A1W1UQ16_DESTI|nr:CBS domain-containing protein [Desulfonispora thiosulfatigenes]SMB83238.1 CBS domain-containing protein [Desulfonispora thiosulfatigenes DSM 11270]
MKVKELMTKDVSSVCPEDSVIEAARIMKQRNVGSIPVCSQNKEVQGILTDRDIALRVVAEGKNLNDVKVSEVMSKSLKSASSEMSAQDAANEMSNSQVRRLPVIENNQMVGMLSMGDLATQNIHVDEAGQALSKISQPSKPLS